MKPRSMLFSWVIGAEVISLILLAANADLLPSEIVQKVFAPGTFIATQFRIVLHDPGMLAFVWLVDSSLFGLAIEFMRTLLGQSRIDVG